MGEPSIRVLLVDDYEPWRRFYISTLGAQAKFQIVGEVSDGMEAVWKAEELQPDLILLDIGLPTLNGIAATWRIRQKAPNSKILFVSENRSVTEEALQTGANGFVLKSDAASELLPAIEAVLRGERFVSASLASHDSNASTIKPAPAITHCHEVEFYADDNSLIDSYARFIESGLRNGNALIVVVTESHRARLISRLETDKVDVATAIERGIYVPLDATETRSRLTVGDMPDPVRCAKVVGDLIRESAKSVEGKHDRVMVCGEIAPTLLSNGNAEGAIRLEHLWDEITRGYGVRTLCGYPWSGFRDRENDPAFQRICTEHSAVHGLAH